MPASQSSSQLLMLGLLALLFGLMWYSSRRARRQQQATTEMRDALVPGTRVMTGSGVFGTVQRIDGDRVLLEIGPGIVTEWLLQAIAKVDEPEAESADEPGAASFDEPLPDDPINPDDPAR